MLRQKVCTQGRICVPGYKCCIPCMMGFPEWDKAWELVKAFLLREESEQTEWSQDPGSSANRGPGPAEDNDTETSPERRPGVVTILLILRNWWRALPTSTVLALTRAKHSIPKFELHQSLCAADGLSCPLQQVLYGGQNYQYEFEVCPRYMMQMLYSYFEVHEQQYVQS